MPCAAMRAVVPLGVGVIEMTYADAQIALHRFHHDVKVVVHQTIGVAHPVEVLADL